MDDPRPTVLISESVLVASVPRFEMEGWRVLPLWDLPDVDQPQARAIIHGGGKALSAKVLSRFPNLGLVANASDVCDGVDLEWCARHRVAVTVGRRPDADDTADHALALILVGWRRILEGDQAVRRGDWERGEGLRSLPTLRGCRLGIVGLGAVGEAIARRGEAFGWSVARWDPVQPAPWLRQASLMDLAQASDILVVACESEPLIRGLVSAEVMAALGPRGMLVDVSQGDVVDEDALIAALQAKTLGGAGLDVLVDEATLQDRWRDVPNTVLTPHIGGRTPAWREAMLDQAVSSVRAYLAGRPIQDVARPAR